MGLLALGSNGSGGGGGGWLSGSAGRVVIGGKTPGIDERPTVWKKARERYGRAGRVGRRRGREAVSWIRLGVLEYSCMYETAENFGVPTGTAKGACSSFRLCCSCLTSCGSFSIGP